jgi:hypothetical protein
VLVDWRGLPFLVVIALLVVGCDETKRSAPPPQTAGAFSPEQFADIPIPRGYVFSPGHDQLAVTLAGGSVRRFDVVLEQRETAEPQPVAALLGEMERDLTAQGWVQAADHRDLLEWTKGQERLVLETGRTGGRTSIRLRLRPPPVAGP